MKLIMSLLAPARGSSVNNFVSMSIFGNLYINGGHDINPLFGNIFKTITIPASKVDKTL